jgi:hypothetical protein
VITLEPGLVIEPKDRWKPISAPVELPEPPMYTPNCTQAAPCPIVGSRKGETFALDEFPVTSADQVGRAPRPRWSRSGAQDDPIYFDHRVFNSGHVLTVCRRRDQRDVCLQMSAMGEDHAELPFLRSPDGRYLFWPFGGAVFDLETMQPLTASRAIPAPQGMRTDFEVDRPGLTLAFEGRLVSYVADAGGTWTRVDQERASLPFGILAQQADDQALQTLASLGRRQYLAVRRDGVAARLDALTGQEVWRISAVGLGEIQNVQLNPQREHALLMGKNAWRLFRLSDGFALSGLLAPPAGGESAAAHCHTDGPLGPGGELLAICGKSAVAWQPQSYSGDIAAKLARLTCAADVKTSALEAIRRCYVNP